MKEYIRKTREERKAEIRAAALDVFLAKGYKNTTMEDVINATSLSKGGFYHYYSSTKEILIDIMKLSNYRFIEGSVKLEKKTSRQEIREVLTQSTLDRILGEKPERKLYLMFAYEMIYDPDFEKIYLQLEQESFALFEKAIRKQLPDFAFDSLKAKIQFLSRLINAVVLAQKMFSDKQVFQNNRDKLEEIFDALYRDILDG